MIKIKDIYAGKPDAKDEVDVEGYDRFLNSFILPSCFNVNSIIDDSFCFISGYKGAGKTALLYYLQDYVVSQDSSTVTSFVLFKGDYSDTERQEMTHASRRLVSSISITNDIVLETEDFEKIWRWLLYVRIWQDNESYSENLFEKNDEWNKFESLIKKINSIVKKRKIIIPKCLKIGTAITENGVMVKPEAEIDFTNPKVSETEAYRKLANYIDELDEIFPRLTKTDIPYYIFVDELEAYFGEEKIFYRDLRLIRDLIFTVKKFNLLMKNMNGGTVKIICSIRKEIINSINRFIVSKELNKTISGFDVSLNWNYNNTNSFSHPILKILLKRIMMAEKVEDTIENEKEIIKKWFPDNSEDFDAASYILNNTWLKPRDIVRLILVSKSGLSGEKNSFSRETLDIARKEYANESLIEIKEEMRALYSETQIDTIFSCLTGFRKRFTFAQLDEKINKYYKKSFLSNNIEQILNDLYRLGVIGNYSQGSDLYRWQHKGDDQLILSDDWNLCVHNGLISALSLSSKHDSGLNYLHTRVNVGDRFEAEVSIINDYYIFVNFEKAGIPYSGFINRKFVNLKSFVVGQNIIVQAMSYDKHSKSWSMIFVENKR